MAGKNVIPVLAALAAFVAALAPGPAAAQDSAGPATVLAAGDIANCTKSLKKQFLVWWRGVDRYYGADKTAALLAEHDGTVLALGDIAYPRGRAEDFEGCYDPVWGPYNERIHPVPGNHEYYSPAAEPYFDYWGAKAGTRGEGYYSFELGAWHIVALNSALDVEGRAAQETWLAADLAATGARCILAYWHHPVFGSGKSGGLPKMAGAFKLLHEAGASVVLNGHNHNYERLAPMAPDGSPDPARGIRAFTAGTGGHSLQKVYNPIPGSEIFDNQTWGLLKLELHADRYTWEFLPVAGESFTDSGEASCVER